MYDPLGSCVHDCGFQRQRGREPKSGAMRERTHLAEEAAPQDAPPGI